MTGPSETVVSVPGARLTVARAGDAPSSGAAPVLLLHGNFSSHRWWSRQLQAPPPGLHLVAPTLPNFAGSDGWAPPADLGAYADAAIDVLDALDLSRAVWVGHSLGTTIAELAATKAPERVAALVLIGGAPPTGLPRPEAHYAFLGALEGNRSGLDAALGSLLAGPKPEFWEALLDDGLAMAPHAYEGNARALGAHRLPPPPAAFDAPVHVLRGAHDPLIDAAAAHASAAHWPRARVETWDEVGHAPQLEAPDRFAEFLRYVSRNASFDPEDGGPAMP